MIPGNEIFNKKIFLFPFEYFGMNFIILSKACYESKNDLFGLIIFVLSKKNT